MSPRESDKLTSVWCDLCQAFVSRCPHDAALLARDARCGRPMVGHGTDTYDPACDLEEGHDGVCKSYDAIDRHHRLLREKP